MEELIKKLTDSAGITEEQAKKSIETVSAYLKSKMPKTFHSQIDTMMHGGTLSEGVKEKLMDTAVDVKETTEDAMKEAAEKMEEAIKIMREKFHELFDKKKE